MDLGITFPFGIFLLIFFLIEAVKDTLKSEDRFLSLPVIELLKTDDILSFYTKTSSTETKHLAIPFSIPLPNDLSGTYISKKGSITYQIRRYIR